MKSVWLNMRIGGELFDRGGDIAGVVKNLIHNGINLTNAGLAGFALLNHLLHGLGRMFYQAAVVFKYLGYLRYCLGGELAYLGGHHGKATDLFARAGGFYGSVQREKVSLAGNFCD
jgi:hypothetical protein